MIKSLIMILFFCLFLIPSANAQFLKDDRYPNWDNRTSGKLNFDTYKSQRKHKDKKKIKRGYRHPANAFLAMGNSLTHSGKPSSCPVRAWCGCWLAHHLGILDRALWLARNWATRGSPTVASPGAIVVWRHHVGKITAVSGNRIKIISGNDGHRVRERWRSIAGAIAIRRI